MLAQLTPETLLSTSEVAAPCQVEPRTVANWCKKGHIAHVTTPSRVVRVRLRDAVQLLRTHGYQVPAEWAAVVPEETPRAATGS